MTLSADPGNLDPQSGAASALFQVARFAYDSLLSLDAGTAPSSRELATDWSVDGTTVQLTLAEGITCSDGSPLTATDVVANLDYVANPENQSPFLGTYYPVGATAVADDAARTVTITLAAPAPFVLNGLADLPIVCAAGMADRASLASATSGTGPYVLSEAAPGDHYTYTIRDGYTWGPAGASTDVAGMPDTVVVRIVENPSTAANLLLTGDVNAATVIGPDAQRLQQEGLFFTETAALIGEMWFNHAEGRPTADPAVRMALAPGRGPRPAPAGAHGRPGFGGDDLRHAAAGRLPGRLDLGGAAGLRRGSRRPGPRRGRLGHGRWRPRQGRPAAQRDVPPRHRGRPRRTGGRRAGHPAVDRARRQRRGQGPGRHRHPGDPLRHR